MLSKKIKLKIFLFFVFLIATSAVIFFVLKSLEENVVYFFSPSEKYNKANILERLVEPDRVVIFRVTWEADNGDKSVTVAELHDFISKNVQDTTAKLYADLPQVPLLFTSDPDRILYRLP